MKRLVILFGIGLVLCSSAFSATRKYAEIYQGRVRTVFTSDVVPIFDPKILLAVDITTRLPEPQPGWLYNLATDTFTISTFPLPPVDADAEAVKVLLSKSSGTFTSSDLADMLKKIAKKLYGL